MTPVDEMRPYHRLLTNATPPVSCVAMSIQTRIKKYGIRRLARKLKVNPSLVSRWVSNNLPAWRKAAVLEALKS